MASISESESFSRRPANPRGAPGAPSGSRARKRPDMPDKERFASGFPPSRVLGEMDRDLFTSASGVHHPASSAAGACAQACLEQASAAAIANFIIAHGWQDLSFLRDLRE